MAKYKVEIQGISDLKMDNWIDGVQPKSEEGYKKQAELKVYLDDKGNIMKGKPTCDACQKIYIVAREAGRKEKSRHKYKRRDYA